MDIGYLLQFQGTLQGYRIGEAMTQIEEIMGISKGTCQILHFLIGFQHLTNLIWYFTESLDNLQVFIAFDSTLCLTHCQRYHGEHCHLSGKGLRGSHTNLRSHMDVSTCIRITGDAAANGIADTIDKGSAFLRQLHGSQCICRLTTL